MTGHPPKLLCGLTGNCHAICQNSNNLPCVQSGKVELLKASCIHLVLQGEPDRDII